MVAPPRTARRLPGRLLVFEQIRSMERLLDFSFEWVLPGHGRIHHAPAREMRASLEKCIEWMEKAA